MNFYEEIKSNRFLLLALILCLAFFIVIIKAFMYLPEANEKPLIENYNTENINKPAKKINQDDDLDKVASRKLNIGIPHVDDIKKADIDFLGDIEKSVKSSGSEELEIIEENEDKAPKQVQKSSEEMAIEFLEKAIKQKENKDFLGAIENLKQSIKTTTDKEIQAKSYEQVALIYAINKKYGTALSYAQKAFNLSPSTSREVLLARIYYKIGEIDNATKRINNVLHRDFTQDREQ